MFLIACLLSMIASVYIHIIHVLQMEIFNAFTGESLGSVHQNVNSASVADYLGLPWDSVELIGNKVVRLPVKCLKCKEPLSFVAPKKSTFRYHKSCFKEMLNQNSKRCECGNGFIRTCSECNNFAVTCAACATGWIDQYCGACR
jgi:hypothetical protein